LTIEFDNELQGRINHARYYICQNNALFTF
jgi:hypothetical protein